MKEYPACNPYVWENVKVLWDTGLVLRRRKEGPCVSEIVNHLVLVYTIAIAIGTVVSVGLRTSWPFTILLALATVYSLPTFWLLMTVRQQCAGGRVREEVDVENFQDSGSAGDASPDGVYDVIGSGASRSRLTPPTARNPFMNVLIDEIKYNPTRGQALSVTDPSVQISLDEFFRTEFNRDPTDVFGKTQSQRQFITMPSTGIPNDVDSYQKWLYGIPGKTCKEGGRESCLPGTDGGALPWLNADR